MVKVRLKSGGHLIKPPFTPEEERLSQGACNVAGLGAREQKALAEGKDVKITQEKDDDEKGV